MDAFEGVVSLSTKTWMGEYENGSEEGQKNLGKCEDWNVA
jgi:hypothetical protein